MVMLTDRTLHQRNRNKARLARKEVLGCIRIRLNKFLKILTEHTKRYRCSDLEL